MLAPSEVALFFANGPAQGDLVRQRPGPRPAAPADRPERAGQRPSRPAPAGGAELRGRSPARSSSKATREALETVVRTRRGPFSMTVLERRFRGDRFDYEVKFTVESKRFDAPGPGAPQEPRQLRRGARRRAVGGAGEAGLSRRTSTIARAPWPAASSPARARGSRTGGTAGATNTTRSGRDRVGDVDRPAEPERGAGQGEREDDEDRRGGRGSRPRSSRS